MEILREILVEMLRNPLLKSPLDPVERAPESASRSSRTSSSLRLSILSTRHSIPRPVDPPPGAGRMLTAPSLELRGGPVTGRDRHGRHPRCRPEYVLASCCYQRANDGR